MNSVITLKELLEYLRDEGSLSYDEAMETMIVVADQNYEHLPQVSLDIFEYKGKRVCQMTVNPNENDKPKKSD